jgi:hypothetical protein
MPVRETVFRARSYRVIGSREQVPRVGKERSRRLAQMKKTSPEGAVRSSRGQYRSKAVTGGVRANTFLRGVQGWTVTARYLNNIGAASLFPPCPGTNRKAHSFRHGSRRKPSCSFIPGRGDASASGAIHLFEEIGNRTASCILKTRPYRCVHMNRRDVKTQERGSFGNSSRLDDRSRPRAMPSMSWLVGEAIGKR